MTRAPAVTHEPARRAHGPARIALVVLLLGTLAGWLVAAWQARANQLDAASRFAALAQRAAESVRARLATYEYGLRGARGTVLAGGFDALDLQHFQLYSASRDLAREFRGARGMGIIRRVPAAQQPAFVEAMQRGGRPAFKVRQLAPNAADRYVIQFIEPVARNRAAVGLDIASEPKRRAAAVQAMDSGLATLTGPITLVQVSRKPLHSFLLLLPIYHQAVLPADHASRRALTWGWAYAPLVMDEVLADLELDGEMWLALRDLDLPGDPAFFRAGPLRASPVGLSRQIELSIYGRRWQADLRATRAFVAGLNLRDPRGIGVTGTALAALFAGLVFVYAQSARRGREIGAEQARRAAIVASSSDAIIGETLDGIVTDWNDGAARLFGRSAAQALGRPAAELILPKERADEDLNIRATIARGESVQAFDSTRVHRDGRLIDVSVCASPIIGPTGELLGFAKTLRDISEAKRAQRQVLQLNAELERQVSDRTSLLDAARRDLQNILDAVPSAIGYWDHQLKNRFANPAYAKWFGMEAAQVPGMRASDLLGPQGEAVLPRMQAALAGEKQVFEASLLSPALGVERDVVVHYLPDEVAGDVRGFYAIVFDITEQTRDRKRLAAALRENEALLSTIDRHAIVSITDPRGRILDINESFCRISGYTRQELVGQPHNIINSGHHDRAFWVAMWRSIGRGQPWRGAICNRRKDGSLYWVDSMIAPIMGEDGRIDKFISMRLDITAAKHLEEQLRASQAFLDRAGEVAGIGAWQLDLASGRVDWSAQMHRIYDVDETYLPTVEDSMACYPPAARAVIDAAAQAAIREGKNWDLVLPLVSMQGRKLWVRTVGEPIREGGRTLRLVGSLQDVTARKEVEDSLAHERHLMASLLDNVPDRIHFKDLEGRYLRVNPALAHHFGLLEPSQAIGKREGEFLSEERAAEVDAIEREIIAGGVPSVDREERDTWRDREPTWSMTTRMPLHDLNGAIIGTFGVSRDITARVRIESELQATHARMVETSSLLRAVLASASDVALIAADPELVIKVWNSGAEQMLGYRGEEVIDRATPLLIHEPSEVQARCKELSALAGEPVEGGRAFTHPRALHEAHEWTYVRKDGGRVPVSLIVSDMRDDRGELFGYLGVAHDVTRQKQSEESLREAKQKAEQASLAKSQFLANMSHEIRTPMNAVIGLSYLLGQTALDQEQTALLSKIRLASKSLLAVINDILDLSKIEAGEIVLERVVFDLPTLLGELRDVMTVTADQKGITFGVEAPIDLAVAVVGDAMRLHQILTNLLSNAIKFTDRGGVRLRVRQQAQGEHAVSLLFEVQDTGVGIPLELQPRLFVPFAQADASTTRRFGGTGLGLSIVKRLADLMGGEVGLRSREGVGSTFWARIVLERADTHAIERSPLPPEHSGGLDGVRVLVVDDSELNLDVAQRILELTGASVTLAHNGQQAIDRLRANPCAYDVVLMDVQMPVLDGREATRRIREELGCVSLPIIALTADAQLQERQRTRAAGMDDFVSKPFEPAALVACIRKHVARPREHAGKETERAEQAQSSWPEIAGIDGEAARARLAGDPELFRRLLGRLVAQVPEPSLGADADAAELARAAAAMHTLRGAAGQLGASRLHALATDAESACRLGDSHRAAQLCGQVNEQLASLREAAAQALTGSSGVIPSVGAQAQGVTPDALRRELDTLLSLLDAQSLSALSRFRASAPRLSALLDPPALERVGQHIEALRFAEAAGALREAGQALLAAEPDPGGSTAAG